MERIIKISKTLRNNWKKSTVGAIALYYGASTAKERYEISVLMHAACKEAKTYGDCLIPMERNPRVVTVILNPVANKRKAKKDFEKYCEPLLHLAGLQVDVVQTAAEGNAKEIVETLRGTEAIIVAGGDGTLAEAITGLLRRNDEANRFPVGILPLGKTNAMGNVLFHSGKGSDKVRQLIEASMAIIKDTTEWRDVMKIEPIVVSEEQAPTRPIYALSSIEWGAFRDAWARKDKYWFVGGLREYATYIFNGYKNSLSWNCLGTIRFTPPCSGCSNCVEKKPEVKRKWAFFIPSERAAPAADLTQVQNPTCNLVQELCFKTSDFKMVTSNVDSNADDVPALKLKLGKNKYSYTEFVSEGWRRRKGQAGYVGSPIAARTVELLPDAATPETEQVAIDNEEFEVKPIRITLMPKAIKLFCKPNH